VTHSRVKLKFLEKSVLQKWQTDAANLNNKIRDYCLRLVPLKDLLQKKQLERRTHNRYAISGDAVVRITESTEDRSFKAELSDISSSGVSFVINTSTQSAELLLGCQLSLGFRLPKVSNELRIDQNGTIVGVHSQLFNEYLINVKWEQPLPENIMATIKSVAKRV
jgi:hypothetical protein